MVETPTSVMLNTRDEFWITDKDFARVERILGPIPVEGTWDEGLRKQVVEVLKTMIHCEDDDENIKAWKKSDIVKAWKAEEGIWQPEDSTTEEGIWQPEDSTTDTVTMDTPSMSTTTIATTTRQKLKEVSPNDLSEWLNVAVQTTSDSDMDSVVSLSDSFDSATVSDADFEAAGWRTETSSLQGAEETTDSDDNQRIIEQLTRRCERLMEVIEDFITRHEALKIDKESWKKSLFTYVNCNEEKREALRAMEKKHKDELATVRNACNQDLRYKEAVIDGLDAEIKSLTTEKNSLRAENLLSRQRLRFERLKYDNEKATSHAFEKAHKSTQERYAERLVKIIDDKKQLIRLSKKCNDQASKIQWQDNIIAYLDARLLNQNTKLIDQMTKIREQAIDLAESQANEHWATMRGRWHHEQYTQRLQEFGRLTTKYHDAVAKLEGTSEESTPDPNNYKVPGSFEYDVWF